MQHQRPIVTRAHINSTDQTLARPLEAVGGMERTVEGKALRRSAPRSCRGDVASPARSPKVVTGDVSGRAETSV
jgi:hypothetical protein